MIDLIFEILPGRLLAFLLALGIAVGGWFLWTGNNEERAMYDAAVGKDSTSVVAEVRRKTTRSESTSGINDHDTGSADVSYLIMSYEDDGDWKSIDARVDGDEFRSTNVGDKIKVSFDPANTDYVVTPGKTRPGVLWYRLGGGILMFIGGMLMLMVGATLLD